MQSDCLYFIHLSLFLEHYNRIFLCELVKELCSVRLIDGVPCILPRLDQFKNWHSTPQ